MTPEQIEQLCGEAEGFGFRFQFLLRRISEIMGPSDLDKIGAKCAAFIPKLTALVREQQTCIADLKEENDFDLSRIGQIFEILDRAGIGIASDSSGLHTRRYRSLSERVEKAVARIAVLETAGDAMFKNMSLRSDVVSWMLTKNWDAARTPNPTNNP